MAQRRGRFVRCGASLVLAVAVMLVALRPVRAAGTGGLEEAITLYEAARYGEALQILEALDRSDDRAEDGGNAQNLAAPDTVAEYRALCLLALDRGPDARVVITRLLERQPAYRPRPGDLPPRFLALVREARTEMLPALVHAEYRAGKGSYDQKAYDAAEAHLRRVVALLDDGDVDPSVKAPLADLGDLANGFLVLIGRAKADTPLPPLPPLAASSVAEAAGGSAIYESGDRLVTPPLVVRQDVPSWRTAGAESEFLRLGHPKGVLEVVIDAGGHVESARLATPVHPLYDSRLLAAARRWEYRPATRAGVPVRFRKVIGVQLGDAQTSEATQDATKR